MFVVVVPMCHHRVELLVAFLLGKLAWYLQDQESHSSQRGFGVRGFWALCLKCIVSSAIGSYLPPLGATKGDSIGYNLLVFSMRI